MPAWQPLLVLTLLIASFAVSALAAVALAIALSSVWPLVAGAGQRWRRESATRAWGPAFEGLLVAGLFGALTWLVLGFVIAKHIPVDRGDHHIMIARADLLMRGLREGQVAHWSHLFQGVTASPTCIRCS